MTQRRRGLLDKYFPLFIAGLICLGIGFWVGGAFINAADRAAIEARQ